MLKIYANSMILMSSTFCSLVIADTTINTTVKWDTTAIKSSKSTLIANASPRMLNFSYSPLSKSFNVVHSPYNVSVLIPDGVTDTVFKAKIMSNSLTRRNDHSRLNVGAYWNGKKLSKITELELDNTAKTSSNLFTFNIESADVASQKIPFHQLENGVWFGDVSLGFTAYWVN